MKFGTDVKTGTDETILAEKQDFAARFDYAANLAQFSSVHVGQISNLSRQVGNLSC
jgi:hypothetical protein